MTDCALMYTKGKIYFVDLSVSASIHYTVLPKMAVTSRRENAESAVDRFAHIAKVRRGIL